ncbi:MAG: hypothetical protein QNJ77_01140 [Acidimicrobiia bacterium]|nr:hypothetical protein [Acidimicrobiia bacterium]
MHDTDNQGVGDGWGAQPALLEEMVGDLPGVSAAEVDLRDDGSPHIRVWLNGSVTSEEVGEQIQSILESLEAGVSAEPGIPARRVGLGRGLGELLEENGQAEVPPHFSGLGGQPGARTVPGLVLVAVEETAGGVSVRVADSEGGIAFSPVENPTSLNQAVTAAVARLLQHRPAPRLDGVEVRTIADEMVLTVVLVLDDGGKVAGAELVRGGLPFTLGRAVWKALAAVD